MDMLQQIIAAIIGGFLIVGYLAFRLGVVKWGGTNGSNTPKTDVNIGVIDAIQKRVLERLDVVESRQEELREKTLPDTYVRKDDMQDLKDSIKSIAEKLDIFIESCRKGECSAGRK